MESQKKIAEKSGLRNREILAKQKRRDIGDLDAKYLVQYAHLTVPATVWKYVAKAQTVNANLVMLDLEDSIPRGNDKLLKQGRENIVRAFTELDWSKSIRTFRPRGLELDPDFSDIIFVVSKVGDKIEGLIYPKVESPKEVESIDRALTELEESLGLPKGRLMFQVLIESVHAEQAVFEIAQASSRLTGLIFGAFDYWGSLGLGPHLYSPDHPLIGDVRCKIVKAAASAGILAIAEMTLNYPTRDKTEKQKQQALDDCRQDAQLACRYGFAGKWVGIPAQAEIAKEVFGLPDQVIAQALKEANAFLEAEKAGRGAAMIDGKMADRATDRINRVILKQAYVLGKVDDKTALRLGLI